MQVTNLQPPRGSTSHFTLILFPGNSSSGRKWVSLALVREKKVRVQESSSKGHRLGESKLSSACLRTATLGQVGKLLHFITPSGRAMARPRLSTSWGGGQCLALLVRHKGITVLWYRHCVMLNQLRGS